MKRRKNEENQRALQGDLIPGDLSDVRRPRCLLWLGKIKDHGFFHGNKKGLFHPCRRF